MKFGQSTAELWIPDGADESASFARVTHMAIAAHQDDIEVMALEGILAGFNSGQRSFMAVVMTNGAGSPRAGRYANYSDEAMRAVRRLEQKKAALIGEYSAVAFLDYPSASVKGGGNPEAGKDLQALLLAARPRILYTHNLADKHDTHVGVALRTVEAVRQLPAGQRPQKLYGCEVWRNLDWLLDSDKVVFNPSGHDNLAAALIGVFDSQISGGKRYDLAIMGRRRANATFFQSHQVDTAESLDFAMDLTPLIQDDQIDPSDYVNTLLQHFATDVRERIGKMK